jgi:hypothetical protein
MPAMMRMVRKFSVGIKAARQLGWGTVWHYAWYQLQLHSGVLRRRTPALDKYPPDLPEVGLSLLLFPLPERSRLAEVLGKKAELLIREADEICAGKARLFGGEPQPLALVPGGELGHWTAHTAYQHEGIDIKFVWEPGRFGWATVLARAYLLTGEEKYARVFWQYTEEFLDANPPNRGPHWASAQEVGLRLIALVFAAGVFNDSTESSPERSGLLAAALAAHAARIPPTLGYARAQNNNHLLSEAAALYTAAAVLPGHPEAECWRELGWRWLHAGLDAQVDPDGEYTQHSTNYHRLMLQVALWVWRVAETRGEEFPVESEQKLAAATHWLLSLVDGYSGKVPNLGSNDGAYFLPLTVCDYGDYRPVLQAAGRAFLGRAVLPLGEWDETSMWLAPYLGGEVETAAASQPLRLEGGHSWATLRATRFSSRPGHADQLHLDLWWHGQNLAMDGGSFQYNADPPWDNALDKSSLHNTLTVDGREQMRKVGRFLWLDWAQAEVLDTQRAGDGRLVWAAAQHDGYHQLGVSHRRTVSCEGDNWLVRDQVWPINETRQSGRRYSIRLHWLLPDWEWELHETTLRLDSGQGVVTVRVSSPQAALVPSLGRGGEILAGTADEDLVRGWVSPTYGIKTPALSFAFTTEGSLPITLTTNWQLP